MFNIYTLKRHEVESFSINLKDPESCSFSLWKCVDFPFSFLRLWGESDKERGWLTTEEETHHQTLLHVILVLYVSILIRPLHDRRGPHESSLMCADCTMTYRIAVSQYTTSSACVNKPRTLFIDAFMCTEKKSEERKQCGLCLGSGKDLELECFAKGVGSMYLITCNCI